jgi:hypothetical protein
LSIIGQWHGTREPWTRTDRIIIQEFNKKFREELITYFPLIRCGWHKKRYLQQFFVVTGTCLLSCCLAMVWGYTHSPFIQNGPYWKWRADTSFIVACIYCRGNMFTKPLPSNDREDTHTYTDWWEVFMKHANEKGSGAIIYIPSFIKITFMHSEIVGEDTHTVIDTQTAR